MDQLISFFCVLIIGQVCSSAHVVIVFGLSLFTGHGLWSRLGPPRLSVSSVSVSNRSRQQHNQTLESYRRLSCLDRLINPVLHQGLHADTLDDNTPDICETISAAKGLVRYLKQSGLAAQLWKTVLQMEETRLSTVYLTLTSVQDKHPELLERIENTAPDLLSFLVTFLEPFYNVQKELEGDKYATINLVGLWLERLKRHCQPSLPERENQDHDNEPEEDEVAMYISQRHAMDDRDLLKWWKVKRLVYQKKESQTPRPSRVHSCSLSVFDIVHGFFTFHLDPF